MPEILRELASDGCTILVSTHDLHALPQLCDEAVLLMHRVLMHGPPQVVLQPENLAMAFGLAVPRGFAAFDPIGEDIDIFAVDEDSAANKPNVLIVLDNSANFFTETDWFPNSSPPVFGTSNESGFCGAAGDDPPEVRGRAEERRLQDDADSGEPLVPPGRNPLLVPIFRGRRNAAGRC